MSEEKDAEKNPVNETVRELDDAALEKLAVEELMREAAQGAARAEIVGPAGWIKAQPKFKTNKRFLANTIRNAVSSNNYHSTQKSQNNSNKKTPRKERHPEPTINKEKIKHKR